MDYRYYQAIERRGSGDFPLKRLPSEVFKKQVWATYQQDLVGLNLIHFFGDGHMMWASDYPHPDSTWPNSMAILEKEMANIDPAMRQRITHDNARDFYKL
jgi:predicted TIM-barrel fold metal-dependent hydrolase